MCMDDDFSGTMCIDHFSSSELAAYHSWHSRRFRSKPRNSDGCPRCGSPQPHLHPCVQEGGEVSLCEHEFHLRETPENTPEAIAELREMLMKLGSGASTG